MCRAAVMPDGEWVHTPRRLAELGASWPPHGRLPSGRRIPPATLELMFADDAHRNCPHCRTHYLLAGNPERWKPACTCEADATRAEEQRALIERARGPLDEAFAEMAKMLRKPDDKEN